MLEPSHHLFTIDNPESVAHRFGDKRTTLGVEADIDLFMNFCVGPR